jgi:hypothetical protein
MATADHQWNAAAVCKALACPGCCDCRDDDSDDNDTMWDSEDPGDFWACPKPNCTDPRDQAGDCPVHEIPLLHIGPDGHEVTS